MAKKAKSGAWYGAVIVVLTVAIVFCSCSIENDENGYVPFTEMDRRFESLGLSSETLRKISHDLEIHHHGECLWHPACRASLQYYFGTYNNYVVMAELAPVSYITSITVAGFEFRFVGMDVYFFVWNNGSIYDIHEALELNFLTLDDIETMYERHNRGETYWGSTLRRIAHDFEIHHFGECFWHPACRVPLQYYFGTYNGYVVMAVITDDSGLSFATVAGFEFHFIGRPVYFFVWNNGRINDIHEAFELNFLTLDDIETMYERHNRRETRWGFPQWRELN